MKFLVTGAAGFVGSAIARSLIESGHSVVGIDSLTDYYSVDLKNGNLSTLKGDRFRFVRADLNTCDLGELLDGVEVVFHEAGQPGVRKSWGNDFADYTSANINATQRLLEACRHSTTIQKIVYASSSSVYGDAKSYPTREVDLPAPLSPYGVSKLAAEHLCSLYAVNYSVPVVSLRYFTVYGPGQRPDMAFTRFLTAAAEHGDIHVFGTGDQIRDFTFIDDIVRANIMISGSDCAPGSVFNVAGGSSISVNEILDVIRGFDGAEFNVVREQSVPGDVFQTGGAIDKIQAAISWNPVVDINDGLAAQYAWARKSRDVGVLAQ